MTATRPRLKVLRRSHCDTCGCVRCKWIDAEIAGSGERAQAHDDDNPWLVEGTLSIDERGGLTLQHDGHMIALEETLAGLLGHHVLVLVGAVKEQT
jgi:hypothetical protein